MIKSLKNICCLVLIILYAGNITVVAQSFPPRDTTIQNMVQEVNADSLKAYVNKLVSFGTRQTLSSITNPERGIGAARNWVLHRMEKYAEQSNGRMTVKLDEWTLAAGHRIAYPHDIGNVLGILKGTDPNDDRVYIVSGHLDSRRTNVMDSVGDAPGADDDGSGVAAVLEMARVMSSRSFKATIIFMVVSGEEQGLYGSEHMAKEAKQENMHIDAMLNNDIIGACNASQTGNVDNTNVRVFSEGIPAVETPEMARMRKLTNGDNDSKSRELARYLSTVAKEYVNNLNVVLIDRPDRFLRGGDQMSFQQQGYTAVRITEYNYCPSGVFGL